MFILKDNNERDKIIEIVSNRIGDNPKMFLDGLSSIWFNLKDESKGDIAQALVRKFYLSKFISYMDELSDLNKHT